MYRGSNLSLTAAGEKTVVGCIYSWLQEGEKDFSSVPSPGDEIC